MDILNEYYPLYPSNPDSEAESDQSETDIYKEKILNLRLTKKRKLNFDDFCTIYSDEIWHLWNIIEDYKYHSFNSILDKFDFPKFCSVCYDNSS